MKTAVAESVDKQKTDRITEQKPIENYNYEQHAEIRGSAALEEADEQCKRRRYQCRITYIGPDGDSFTEEGIVGTANTIYEAIGEVADRYIDMGYRMGNIECD